MSSTTEFRAQAMVLAAGRGERMRPLTDHTPKPLLPVRGKPLMQHSLEQLAAAGVGRIVINTGWLGQQVADAWPAATHFGGQAVQIRYSREDLDFGGGIETTGGISRALPLLDDAFWLVSGDVFIPGFPFDEALRQRFAQSSDLAHLWLVPNAPHHPKGDFVLTEDDRADADRAFAGRAHIGRAYAGRAYTGRAETPAADDSRPRLTYCSVALLKKELFVLPFCDIPPGNPQGVKMPLVNQLRAAMLAGRCGASRYDGVWVDVGTPERLAAIGGDGASAQAAVAVSAVTALAWRGSHSSNNWVVNAARSPRPFPTLLIAMKKTLLAIAAAAALSLTVSGCSDSSAASISYNATLDQASQAEKAAVLKTLQELVNIETGTNDAVGIPQMGNYLEARLQALGANVVRHKAEAGVVGDNIVGTFQGSGTKSLLLMAHMDTVYARGILATAPFKVEGDKAYGAGIADAKGGIAVILHSLGLLKAQNFSKFKTITVMFNTDEEKGSFGSRDLIQKLAAAHDYVLSYEPSGLEEGFGTATSGIAYVQAVVHGKASHAGVAPEAGINALTEASALVLRTQDVQDKSKERGFNWTTMTAGGTATNIIPDKAVVNADVRYGKNEDLELMKGMLDKAAAAPHVPGATIDINLTRGRPAFNATDDSVKLIQKAITIYADVGGKSQMYTTRGGGGSDAAYAALSGKPVIEGLGLPGANYHSNLAEYVLTEPIARRLYLSAQLISDLGQGM